MGIVWFALAFFGVFSIVCLFLCLWGRPGRDKTPQQEAVCTEASAAEAVILKADNDSGFNITRKEIAEDIRAMNNPQIKVVERFDQPQLPMSIMLKKSTYAMLYGTDNGVLMIVKISDKYAGELSRKHSEVCRATFPRGANWYSVPVNGVFGDKQQVYAVLNAAAEFVGAKSRQSKIM